MSKILRKLIPYGIAVVVLGGAGAFYTVAKNDNKLVSSKPDVATTQSLSNTYKVVNACEVVTQTDADAMLGAGAKKGDNSVGDTSSDDINVSTCSYSQSGTFKSLTLLARSAKTSEGANSNHDQFTTLLPNGALNVEGFGDDAYWDPAYGQLNIRVHNNWYILSIGGLRPAEKSIDETKTFATRVMSRL